MPKFGTPVNTPTVAVQQLVALEKTLDALDLPLTSLDAAKAALVDLIDALPISYRGKRDGVKYFALVGGEWWTCHEGVVVNDEADGLHGALRWKCITADGEISSGVAMPHEWAKVDADGAVDYHWLA